MQFQFLLKYFLQVGGDVTAAVLQNIKLFGRISICGAVSAYNGDDSKGMFTKFYSF